MHNISTSIFKNLTVSDALDRMDLFVDEFNVNGIIALRGHRYSEDDVLTIMDALGSRLSWTPFVQDTGSSLHWHYTQQYDTRVEELSLQGRNGSEEILIEWHVEGASLKDTQRAGGWNMDTFSAPKGTGSTGFVDMAGLVTLLPEPFYKLLSRSTIIHVPNWQHQPESAEEFKNRFLRKVNQGLRKIWTLDGDSYVASYARPAIERHPDFGFEVLRICPCAAQWGVQDHLLLVDKGLPTKDEQLLFEEVLDWVRFQISANQENQFWWDWQENDFLIPDLFRLAHGVRGGFDAGQRKFEGYWAFPHGVGSQPTEFMSIEEYEGLVKF